MGGLTRLEFEKIADRFTGDLPVQRHRYDDTRPMSSRAEVDVTSNQDLSLVLRFPEVAIARTFLEALLWRKMDRFEPSKATTASYAQLNLPERADAWSVVTDLAKEIGPAVSKAVQRGDFGRPFVDVAYFFPDGHMTGTFCMPNSAVLALGVAGFDVNVSVYRAVSDQE